MEFSQVRLLFEIEVFINGLWYFRGTRYLSKVSQVYACVYYDHDQVTVLKILFRSILPSLTLYVTLVRYGQFSV